VILPIGAMVACFFGVLLGSPTLKLRGDYLAIVTLGFGEIVRIFMNNLNAPINITNGPQGITLIDPVAIGSFKFSGTTQIFGVSLSGPQKYYYLLVALASWSSSSTCACKIRASAAPGRRSARTRSPPRRSASTRATSSCWPSPWAPASAVSPAAFRRDAGLRLAGELLADRVDHDPGHGRARRHGAHSRRHPRRGAAQHPARGLRYGVGPLQMAFSARCWSIRKACAC
jgi:hypothetical protein